MKKIIIIITLCIAVIGTVGAQNLASNTRVQAQSNLMIVYYDLADKSDVEAYVSFDNGARWQGPIQEYSGSAGRGVESGKDKIIIWHSIEEIGSVERNATIRVIATKVGTAKSPDIQAFLASVTPGVSLAPAVVAEVPEARPAAVVAPPPSRTGQWLVIIGSFQTRTAAERYIRQIQGEGLNCEIVDAGQQRFRVSAGRFDSIRQAINLQEQLRPARNGQVWIARDE